MLMFEWDDDKAAANLDKHGVSFETARETFAGPRRLVIQDVAHSTDDEARLFCIGEAGGGVLTARFTMRSDMVRIIGAGYWRKGKHDYEQANNIH